MSVCNFKGLFLKVGNNFFLQLLVLLYLAKLNFVSADGGDCPEKVKGGNALVPTTFVKPCTGKFSYCLSGKDPLPWDCPRSLVYNPGWHACDSRKACKHVMEEGDDDCLGRPCSLYPGDQCNKYYVCSGGTKKVKRCVGTFIFDYISKECKDPNKGAKCKESLVRRPIVPKDVAPEEPHHISDPCLPHNFEASEGKRSKFNDGTMLGSPMYTNFGQWQKWSYCSNGSYVTGVQVWKRSTEADNGDFDHAGVVSLGFKCEDPMQKLNSEFDVIGQCANGAPDTEYEGFLECQKGVGVGLQLSQLPEQGALFDDVATDNVKMYCSCGKNNELSKPYHKKLAKYIKVGGQRGKWTIPMFCARKQAMCGFRTQMHDWVKDIIVKLEESDMTGMNQVKVKCCDVPSPGQCIPKQSKWFVQTCDNSDAEVTRPCPFNATVGIVYNTRTYERAAKFFESIGYTLKDTLGTIKESIETGIQPCANEEEENCEQQWKTATDRNARIYMEGERESNKKLIMVKPGAIVKVYQTTVSCGIYKMYTNQIIKEDQDGVSANEVLLF